MDEKAFKELASRLEAAGAVIAKVPAEIRSTAFELLRPYVTGQQTFQAPPAKPGAAATGDVALAAAAAGDREAFFGAHNHDKPADNVRLIVADFYREYGSAPFTVSEINEVAKAVGITVPARPDMTLKGAKENGKKLFQSSGRGLFSPTVHGEASLKAQYHVKKGTKVRPTKAEG
jgi:hypothetical protein